MSENPFEVPTRAALEVELEVEEGPSKGERHVLRRFPAFVGRGQDVDVRLEDDPRDPKLSRRHVRLNVEGGRMVLTDLSTNGTWIGERHLASGESVTLEGGEDVWLGPQTLIHLRPLGTARPARLGGGPSGARPVHTPPREAALPSETGLELAVRALGPLSVEIEGRPVPDSAWGSRKSIVLLVFLADAGGRATSADRLGEALWPDALEGARAVLQTTVSRVRKAFRAVDPALPDPVAHDRTGYRIPEAYAIDSDVRRFEGLCKAEDEASLQEALALYRGPFLEGLSDDWVESRRRSLDGLFFEAMDRLATVLEETDRATEAVRLYERVLEREPCREQSQVGLLRALARSGRRDEAVRRYHDCVRALKKILGVGPGPALVATYHELRG